MDRKEFTYKILKLIQNGTEPHWNNFSLTKEEFGNEVDLIEQDNLLENVTISRGGIGNKVLFVHLKHSKITSDGARYIENYEQ